MGIAFIFLGSRPGGAETRYAIIAESGITYYSLSISLNILLTLMIVGRLALHSRIIRNGLGALARPHELYNTIVTILVESCALYTVSYLLFLGPWASQSPVCNAFFPMLAGSQVRAT